MSRHVAVPARTPRAVETESGEADPAAAARIGAAAKADEPTCRSVHAAHGALPSPTALRCRAAAPTGVASLAWHDAGDLFAHAVAVRHAVEADQASIVALVRSEHLNPTDLDWRRFVVASDGVSLVGAAQLRANHDGSHELSSLVVRPHARGRGVATRMIELLTFDRRERL